LSYVLRLCHSLNPSLNALELLGSLLFLSSAYERCSNRARVLGFGIGRFPDRVIDLRHRCFPRCFSILPLFMVCYTFFHALLIFYRKKMETLAFINLLFLSLLPAQPAPATVKAVRRKTTIKKGWFKIGEGPQAEWLFLDFILQSCFLFNFSFFDDYFKGNLKDKTETLRQRRHGWCLRIEARP